MSALNSRSEISFATSVEEIRRVIKTEILLQSGTRIIGRCSSNVQPYPATSLIKPRHLKPNQNYQKFIVFIFFE